MKCDRCSHSNVCKYMDAYKEYFDVCNVKSRYPDKFKVEVSCSDFEQKYNLYRQLPGIINTPYLTTTTVSNL